MLGCAERRLGCMTHEEKSASCVLTGSWRRRNSTSAASSDSSSSMSRARPGRGGSACSGGACTEPRGGGSVGREVGGVVGTDDTNDWFRQSLRLLNERLLNERLLNERLLNERLLNEWLLNELGVVAICVGIRARTRQCSMCVRAGQKRVRATMMIISHLIVADQVRQARALFCQRQTLPPLPLPKNYMCVCA